MGGPAGHVEWFRVRNQQWIDAYARPLGPSKPSSAARRSGLKSWGKCPLAGMTVTVAGGRGRGSDANRNNPLDRAHGRNGVANPAAVETDRPAHGRL